MKKLLGYIVERTGLTDPDPPSETDDADSKSGREQAMWLELRIKGQVRHPSGFLILINR